MRLATLFGMGLVGAVSNASAQNNPGAFIPIPQISVSASGETKAMPDQATVQFSVQTRATTARQAGLENSRLQTAVFDTLRGLGLAKDQLSTTDYSVYPDQQYNETTRQSRIVGYVVTNTIRVETKKLDQVGAIIDAALGKGVNMVSSLTFSLSEPDQARRSALAQAVERARKEAEAIAQAAGGALGDLLEISSSEISMPSPRFEMAQSAALKSSAPPTPVSPGAQSIIANVSARWRYIAPTR